MRAEYHLSFVEDPQEPRIAEVDPDHARGSIFGFDHAVL
jgi:hypothetical protein